MSKMNGKTNGKAKMVATLRELRTGFECDGVTLAEVQIPAVFLLSDVCDRLNLNDGERREVLGPEGEAFLRAWEATPIRLETKANGQGMPVRL